MQELPDPLVFAITLSASQLLKCQRVRADDAFRRGKATKGEASNGSLLGTNLGQANHARVEEAGLCVGLDAKVGNRIRDGGAVEQARLRERGGRRGPAFTETGLAGDEVADALPVVRTGRGVGPALALPLLGVMAGEGAGVLTDAAREASGDSAFASAVAAFAMASLANIR